MCLFRSCLLVDWKEFSFRVKTIYRIIIGKHFFTFFSSEIFARLDLQTLSIVFFLSHRIAFRLYALQTSQPSSSTPQELRKMMDGSRTENDLSVCRSLGNVGMQTTEGS